MDTKKTKRNVVGFKAKKADGIKEKLAASGHRET